MNGYAELCDKQRGSDENRRGTDMKTYVLEVFQNTGRFVLEELVWDHGDFPNRGRFIMLRITPNGLNSD